MVRVFMENKKNLANSDIIYYDFNRRLTWKDFQGIPDVYHFGGAVTSSGFAFNSEMNFDGENMNLIISEQKEILEKK